MKVLIIITIGDVHYPEGLCTASPRELFCQLLLIFLCSLQPLWLENPHEGETHKKHDPDLNKSHWVESGDAEPWMDARRTARTSSSCLGEQLGSITRCANSLWFGFPLRRRGQMLCSEAAMGSQPLGCISGLNLPLCDAPFGGGQAAGKGVGSCWMSLLPAKHPVLCAYRSKGNLGPRDTKIQSMNMKGCLCAGAPPWSVTGY